MNAQENMKSIVAQQGSQELDCDNLVDALKKGHH